MQQVQLQEKDTIIGVSETWRNDLVPDLVELEVLQREQRMQAALRL
jgi:hypothetical protein